MLILWNSIMETQSHMHTHIPTHHLNRHTKSHALSVRLTHLGAISRSHARSTDSHAFGFLALIKFYYRQG